MAITESGSGDVRHVEIHRYPNRRYYDPPRGACVTLQEIRNMVRDGSDIRVIDSKSGEDVTAKVLAQIILEQEPAKLQILPIDFLHQLIRANDQLVRGFVESFFNHALLVFIESQRLFERYLHLASDVSGSGQVPGGAESPAAQGGQPQSPQDGSAARAPVSATHPRRHNSPPPCAVSEP
jgi:polyhydroxyalkanoate synthesis repressor PhaR